MTIHLLSEQLASQIAAGEVVERPASVVKELLENSIDAGATTINVDIRQGGRDLIQIADNGVGIDAAEIETAFLRHATSKLTTAEDLNSIATLGFRGEALAAIAAVSQLTVVSRTSTATAGTRLVLDGGHAKSQETVGAPQGTIMAIENLFYNVPARLKFLKSITTEKRLIDDFVSRYALAYPHIRFRLTHNGRITFQTSGNGQLLDVLVSVYGPENARQLMAVGNPDNLQISGEAEIDEAAVPTLSTERHPINVTGYVGPPSLHWSNRNHIILFVNGRWIKDNSLTYAVIQAYHTLLPTGRYPLAVLFVTMPPQEVDVNVHPTKTEVRFRQSRAVFGTIQRAVRQTLIADSPIRTMDSQSFSSDGLGAWTGTYQQSKTAGWAGSLDNQAFKRREAAAQSSLGLDWSQPTPEPILHSNPDSTNGEPSSFAPALTRSEDQDNLGHEQNEHQENSRLGARRLPIMRVVGQVGASYIITEGPDGIFMIDQHAAHERILYEQFMAEWGQEGIVSQGLMAGTAIHLAPAQATLLEENIERLAQLGFQIDSFGPNAFMVRAIPAILAKQDPAQAIVAVVEDLERGDKPMQGKIEARIVMRVCKTAAVKAGQTLSIAEMEAMIQQLEACQNPHTCPHGRPTLIHLSVAQLAKQFGRT